MQRTSSISNFAIFNRNSRPTVPQPALDTNITKQLSSIPMLAKFKTKTLDFDFEAAENDPTAALQQLHHLGALLMNSGKAYSALLMGDDISGKPVTTDEQATHSKLISIYNDLPDIKDGMTVTQGHPAQFTQAVSKILHALLVIRIALDHLPAEKIYKLYEAFMRQNRKTPLASTLTSFADGSGFVGSYAAEQVLHRYICNNLMLFPSMPLSAVEDALRKEGKFNELICIGGLSKREQINSYMMVKLTALHQPICDNTQTNINASRKG